MAQGLTFETLISQTILLTIAPHNGNIAMQ